MAPNLTSDDESVKATAEKIYEYLNQSKRISRKEEEYLKALKEFNQAFLNETVQRNAKSTKALLEKIKESSEGSDSNYQGFKDFSEKFNEYLQEEMKDKSSLKLLLEELLNESSNRINHLEKLKEKKLALLKSI